MSQHYDEKWPGKSRQVARWQIRRWATVPFDWLEWEGVTRCNEGGCSSIPAAKRFGLFKPAPDEPEGSQRSSAEQKFRPSASAESFLCLKIRALRHRPPFSLSFHRYGMVASHLCVKCLLCAFAHGQINPPDAPKGWNISASFTFSGLFFFFFFPPLLNPVTWST